MGDEDAADGRKSWGLDERSTAQFGLGVRTKAGTWTVSLSCTHIINVCQIMP